MYRGRRNGLFGYSRYRGYGYYHMRFIMGIVMIPIIITWFVLQEYLPGILERLNFTLLEPITVSVIIIIMFGIPYLGAVIAIASKWRKE